MSSANAIPLGAPRGAPTTNEEGGTFQRNARDTERAAEAKGRALERRTATRRVELAKRKLKHEEKAAKKRARKVNDGVHRRSTRNYGKYVVNKERNRERDIELERRAIRANAVRQAEALAAKYDPSGRMFNVGEVVVLEDGTVRSREAIRAAEERKAERELQKDEEAKAKAIAEKFDALKEGGVNESRVAFLKKNLEMEEKRNKKYSKRVLKKRELFGPQPIPKKPVIPEGIEIPEGEVNWLELWDLPDLAVARRVREKEKEKAEAHKTLRRLEGEKQVFNKAMKHMKKAAALEGVLWDEEKSKSKILAMLAEKTAEEKKSKKEGKEDSDSDSDSSSNSEGNEDSKAKKPESSKTENKTESTSDPDSDSSSDADSSSDSDSESGENKTKTKTNEAKIDSKSEIDLDAEKAKEERHAKLHEARNPKLAIRAVDLSLLETALQRTERLKLEKREKKLRVRAEKRAAKDKWKADQTPEEFAKKLSREEFLQKKEGGGGGEVDLDETSMELVKRVSKEKREKKREEKARRKLQDGEGTKSSGKRKRIRDEEMELIAAEKADDELEKASRKSKKAKVETSEDSEPNPEEVKKPKSHKSKKPKSDESENLELPETQEPKAISKTQDHEMTGVEPIEKVEAISEESHKKSKKSKKRKLGEEAEAEVTPEIAVKKSKKSKKSKTEEEEGAEAVSEPISKKEKSHKSKKSKKSKEDIDEDIKSPLDSSDKIEEVETNSEKPHKSKKSKKSKSEKEEEDQSMPIQSEIVKPTFTSTQSIPQIDQKPNPFHQHHNASQWNPEALKGGDARKDKFLRLLGAGKKSSVVEGEAVQEEETSQQRKERKLAKKAEEIAKVESELARQYEYGMAMKEAGGKRRGLGA